MAETTIQGAFGSPTIYRDTALTSTVVSGCTTSCELMGWNIINPNGTDVYVKFCDSAGATAGTTAIVKTLMIPANSTVYLESRPNSSQIFFGTAMMIYCVTGLADNNTTAPSTAIHACFYYKKAN